MKPVNCTQCGQALCVDEVALNQRLLGMQIGAFSCIPCLAQKLNTTPAHLDVLTARFKEMGCAYFTRLMEASSHENTYDSL